MLMHLGNGSIAREDLTSKLFGKTKSFFFLQQGYWQAYKRGEYWTLKLDPNAKLAIIDSEADLKDLMNCFLVYNPTEDNDPERAGVIDWTRLSKQFDACFLTRKGEKETRSPGGIVTSRMVDGEEATIVTDEEIDAYFESVVVFNTAAVQVVFPPVTRDP